jgi:regulator of cell morphogenesis and NO signaling
MNTVPLIKLKDVVGNEAYFSAKTLNAMNIDGNEIKDAIDEGDNTKFNKYDTDFLIDYIIKTHHAFAKKNAIIIYNLTQKVAYSHSHEHNELKKFNEVAFFFFHDLLNQMSKEEQNLFPYLRQTIREIKYKGKIDNAASQSLKEKIQLQQAEHKRSFNYLENFREITSDYEIPFDACNHYNSLFEKMKELEYDLTRHFYLEDEILSAKLIALQQEPDTILFKKKGKDIIVK